MIRSFLISLWLLCLASCAIAPRTRHTGDVKLYNMPIWSEALRSEHEKNSYRMKLTRGEDSFSGICILKKDGEQWLGSVINEFGSKAFDFRVTEKKAELLHVIPLMDKWYIRRTIAGDIHFLVECDNPYTVFKQKTKRYTRNDTLFVDYKHKQLTISADSTITLANKKHDITYVFRKITNTDNQTIASQ